MSDADEGDAVIPSGRGVSDLWTNVNHVAIVVSDIGKSLAFYADVIGMKQVLRPDFDRHGAWLTFGNVDLHLIKGRPAVHSDDDLIVSHIAITVSDMAGLRRRLEDFGVASRKNVSVPNPATKSSVDQAFVRDPDGYYIEFCNCDTLEKYLHDLAESRAQEEWNIIKTHSLLRAGKMLKQRAHDSKNIVQQRTMRKDIKDEDSDNNSDDSCHAPDSPEIDVDKEKLANLVKRRRIYGDIAQSAESEDELEKLLKKYNNKVPKVILHLEERVRRLGLQTYIPPAFYDRDGKFYQPPSFQMRIGSGEGSASPTGHSPTSTEQPR